MLKHEPFQTVTSLVHGRLAFTRPLRGRHNHRPLAMGLCEGDKLFLWCLIHRRGNDRCPWSKLSSMHSSPASL